MKKLKGGSGKIYLQLSMVLGRDSIRLPATLRTLSLERQPIEFGSDFNWFEWTSSTITLSNLAVNDSGISCWFRKHTPLDRFFRTT